MKTIAGHEPMTIGNTGTIVLEDKSEQEPNLTIGNSVLTCSYLCLWGHYPNVWIHTLFALL